MTDKPDPIAAELDEDAPDGFYAELKNAEAGRDLSGRQGIMVRDPETEVDMPPVNLGEPLDDEPDDPDAAEDEVPDGVDAEVRDL